MKSISNVVKKVSFVLFTFFVISISFNACGYKPTVSYAKKEITGKIFVKLFVNLKDPKNSVLIKDTIDELLVQKLGSKLVYDKSLADNIIYLRIDNIKFETIQYDKNGYNKLYKTTVNILVKNIKKLSKKVKTFTVSGENNFSVDDGNTISDTKRFNAIKNASDDALDEVLSKIAIFSFK